MTSINYDDLNLDELRRYVLTHRENINAFYAYVDRSKADGRMITVDLNDNHWEDNVTTQIQQDQS